MSPVGYRILLIIIFMEVTIPY